MRPCRGCAAPCEDQAEFCAHCGARLDAPFSWSDFSKREKTGEAPSTLSCPRCRTAMMSVRFGGWTVDECRSCRGLWFDRAEVEPMLERFRKDREEALGRVAAAASHRSTISEMQVQYVRCPRCQDLMSRFNYAQTSGVIVDRCGRCGLWLDGGEFEKISAFLGTSAPPPDVAPPGSTDPALKIGIDNRERRSDSFSRALDFLSDLLS